MADRNRRMFVLSSGDRLFVQSLGAVVVAGFLVKDVAQGSTVKAILDTLVLVWSFYEIRRCWRRVKSRRD